MTYKIFQTKSFKKDFNKLSKDIKKIFFKKIEEIANAPKNYGKPLGYKFFREILTFSHRIEFTKKLFFYS